MAHHQHVQVLVDGVLGEGSRGVGGGREHVLSAAHRDDVGSVASTGALAVVGMSDFAATDLNSKTTWFEIQ